MICEKCGADGAFEGIDPYAQDIYGEIVEVVWCDECYQNAADDI